MANKYILLIKIKIKFKTLDKIIKILSLLIFILTI
jgi:hypothetical protein